MIDEYLNQNEYQTGRLIIKPSDPFLSPQYFDYLHRNHEHFKYAVPYDLQRINLDKCLEIMWKENDLAMQGLAYRLLLFNKDDYKYEKIIGDLSLYNFLPKPILGCSLGYKLDKDHLGLGLMNESVVKVIDLLFNKINYHRIEISINPDNDASIRFSEKIGFVKEGILRKFSYIDSRWVDFFRYSIINDNLEME